MSHSITRYLCLNCVVTSLYYFITIYTFCAFAQTVSSNKNGLQKSVVLYRVIHALDWQEPTVTDDILRPKKHCFEDPVWLPTEGLAFPQPALS